MKRGEIWTASGSDSLTKPRPVVILQDHRFDATNSITICPLTTDPTEAPLFRPLIEPGEANGLNAPSRLMADKVTTVQRSKLGQRLGTLTASEIVQMNRAVLVFLGLAGSAVGRARVKPRKSTEKPARTRQRRK